MKLFGIKLGKERKGNSIGNVPRGTGKGPGYNAEILPPYSTKPPNILAPGTTASQNLSERLISSKVFIYTLAHPITDEVRYVGKTSRFKIRAKSHFATNENTPKGAWIKSLRKQGLTPKIEVLEEVDESAWQESERFWIEYLRHLGCKLTNLTPGGDGVPKGFGLGRHLSPAHGEKIRQANLNRGPDILIKLRKPKPEGFGAKISKAKLGVKRSPEFCAKMRIIAKNRSPESRAKQAASLRGKSRSLESRLRQSETIRKNGLSPNSLKGLQKGWGWNKKERTV